MKKVLIVDDTKFMRSMLRNIQKKDVDVVGKLRRKKLLKNTKSCFLTLSPWNYNEMNGIQAVKAILAEDPQQKY